MLNNPLIPGDPYSYDLKWLVARVKEILAKLGTLDEVIEEKIFEAFLEHSIVQFKTVEEMLAADIKDGSIVLTLGYHEAGDLGGLFYLVKDFNPSQCSLDYFLTLDNNKQIAIPVIVTPYVTPEMFGAYGNGVQDDSEALQLAVKKGDVIMHKTYYISQEIEVVDNSTLTGGTLLDHVPEGSVAFEFPAVLKLQQVKNVKLQDVTIQGPGSRTDASEKNRSVIKIADAENVDVIGCKIYDTDADIGVRVRHSEKVNIEHIKIDGYSYSGVAFTYLCKDVRVCDSEFYNLTGTYPQTYPISLSGYEGTERTVTTNAICSGNIIECPFPNWEGIDAHGGDGIVITGNVIKGTKTGIAVIQSIDTPILTKNVVITDNLIELGTDTSYGSEDNNSGIFCLGDDAVVANNVIKNAGVCCDGHTPTGAIQISGNGINCHDNVIESTNGHVILSRYGSDISIKNNVVKGWTWNTPSGTPYFLKMDFSGTFGDVFVCDNMIDNAPTGANVFRVSGNFASAGGYMLVKDNAIPSDFVDGGNVGYVVFTPYYGPPSRNGRKGDLVINSRPATGQPMGWICTADYTLGQGGAWAALPNL